MRDHIQYLRRLDWDADGRYRGPYRIDWSVVRILSWHCYEDSGKRVGHQRVTPVLNTTYGTPVMPLLSHVLVV